MKVSTKGRYALRVMIDLAQHQGDGFISLKEVAQRQGISMKYLEMIVGILNRAGFVTSLRGKSGGYMLARDAKEYTVGAILKLTEGSMAPVSCLENGSITCDRAEACVTLPLWKGLDNVIDRYLESITLQDMVDQADSLNGNNYVI
ncbi:MAG: Rrf2 family transcriptional regulator [Lachnospiraceae bacterium]|nr:Rrf2 family transcriptional regulator [Lachnospiraceae bacterium]